MKTHSPPSGNNIPARKKKSERRNVPKGTSRIQKQQERLVALASHIIASLQKYKADRCKKCGSTGLTHKKIHQKQVTDIVFTVQTKTHCSYKSTCRCGCVTDSTPEWLKRNSSICPTLTALGALAWYNANSLRSIKILLGFFGVKVCKRTVENMITSTAASMKKEVSKIDQEMENTKFGKMDETPIIVENHQGYVWVCVGDDAVSIHASHTRSAVVPEQLYWFCLDKPITVDGFTGYNGFKLRQRCWSHILREAEHSADTPETAMLYEKLQMLFHEAKQMGPSISITSRTRCIAQEYTKLGSKFGTKLGNAAENLYTFVSHPGMHPTNNESERMLRKVVIHRKIRQRLVTNGGMRTFEVIMSCMLTWGKRNLDLSGKLLEVLWAT